MTAIRKNADSWREPAFFSKNMRTCDTSLYFFRKTRGLRSEVCIFLRKHVDSRYELPCFSEKMKTLVKSLHFFAKTGRLASQAGDFFEKHRYLGQKSAGFRENISTCSAIF